MTPAQKDRLTGFNASLKQRGVSVLLHTNLFVTADGTWTADSTTVDASGVEDAQIECLALIEPITAKLREQLNIADQQISHVVHVLRTVLKDDAGNPIDRKAILQIDRSDTSHTYRVQDFVDDAQRPSVMFHCILA